MQTDRFRTGDLAWLRTAARDGEPVWGNIPGQSDELVLDAPAAVTIIRRARCGDYSAFHRRNHTYLEGGQTLARHLSRQSWLVLIAGTTWLIKDKFLNKRRYKARAP